MPGSVSVAVAVVSDVRLVDALALAESCPDRDSPGRQFAQEIVLIILSEKSIEDAPIWCCCISESGNRDWEEEWLGLAGWWYWILIEPLWQFSESLRILSSIWPNMPWPIHLVSSKQFGLVKGIPVAHSQSDAHLTILLLPVLRINVSIACGFC